jgi:CheY-like chemotaxis protein
MKQLMASQKDKQNSISPDADPRRILVVDDEPDVGTLTLLMLRSAFSSEIDTAVSGHEALGLAAQQPFDVMVIDYMMPQMSGIELAQEIHKRYPQTAMVMLTAFPEPDLDKMAAQVSIHCVLRKPATIPALREAIIGALSH